jgi:hypothetical protein
MTDGATGGVVDCPDYVPPYVFNFPHHWPPLGSVTEISFGNCTDSLGQTLTLTAGGLPWGLNAVSYNSGTGVTTGTVTGIDISVSGSGCSATIDGTSAGADNGQVADTYTNGTGQLNISTSGGNLHVYNVSGRSGLFSNGSAVTLSATFTLNPRQTIT